MVDIGSVHLSARVLHCPISTVDRGGCLDSAAMAQVAHALGGDLAGIGSVLLYGAGRDFCTGGDVRAFAAAADPAGLVAEQAAALHRFITAIASCPVPVVAAVTGWAAGAGMSTALVADVVVGGSATRFRPAYPSLGFSPDGGMSWTLPRRIGAARAADVLLTDAVIGGVRAHAWGLLTRLVPDDEVRETALELATALATGPTGAHAATRSLLSAGAGRTLTEHLLAEATSITACAGSPDGREGVQAFLARRPPVFGAQLPAR